MSWTTWEAAPGLDGLLVVRLELTLQGELDLLFVPTVLGRDRIGDADALHGRPRIAERHLEVQTLVRRRDPGADPVAGLGLGLSRGISEERLRRLPPGVQSACDLDLAKPIRLEVDTVFEATLVRTVTVTIMSRQPTLQPQGEYRQKSL